MREIKLRAWVKSDRTLLDVVEISWYSKNVRCVTGGMMICPATGATQADFDFPLYEMDDIILMQYTGLKDKYGVEIYEGDIYETEYGNAVVAWNEIAARFELFISKTQYWSMVVFKVNYYSKKGNIHENPELLEEKDK